MHLKKISARGLLAALFLATQAAAQTKPAADADPELVAASEAVKLRADLADAVGKDAETSSTALAKLRSRNSSSGLKVDPDADFAYASMDVGLRLTGQRKTEVAEDFFKEAEQAFASAIAKVPETKPAEKAILLQNLAHIRGTYLNKWEEAREAIDEAIKLQPEDKWLQRFRASLAKEHADVFKDQRKS